MKIIKTSLMIYVGIILSASIFANNIQVNNAIIAEHNESNNYVMIQFDLQWENSWRTNNLNGDVVTNWDAAWVFLKYKVNGVWNHVKVNNNGHIVPAGATMDLGLYNPGNAYNINSNPVIGLFFYRNANGTGTFAINGIRLRWNYQDNGVNFNDVEDIKIYGIEMVYVAEGSFYVGDGNTTNSEMGVLHAAGNPGQPFQITSESLITTASSGTGNLWGTGGVAYPQSYGEHVSPADPHDIPGTFPKGFKPYYCMKYKISQQGYVDFINTLTRQQQGSRTRALELGSYFHGSAIATNQSTRIYRNGIRFLSDPGAPLPRVFGCDFNGNNIAGETDDGTDIECNFLNWGDVTAYLDWTGLRPMTELEFEKAARGPTYPLVHEYAWGTNTIINNGQWNHIYYQISNSASPDEGITNNFSTTLGNAFYNFTTPAVPESGPHRVGIFAANPANNGRVSAGASYYGIMEMSGSLFDVVIGIGTTESRQYTGNHGNGLLNITGFADETTWTPVGVGNGIKGGRWSSPMLSGGVVANISISDRQSVNSSGSVRSHDRGGRGVRTAP
jgi:formylglycine-generating enzyme required for sulfatase activity